MDGRDPIGLSTLNGAGAQRAVPGGALELWQSGPDGGPPTMAVD